MASESVNVVRPTTLSPPLSQQFASPRLTVQLEPAAWDILTRVA